MRNEVAGRLLWIVLVLALIAYASYLFFGSFVSAETEKSFSTVEVIELVDQRTYLHRLSGFIIVPTPCHSIEVETKQLGENDYHIYFRTFGESHGCTEEPEPRNFQALFTAPLVGNSVTATLDGKTLDFRIVRSNYGELTE